MEQRKSWLKGPLPQIALALWFGFHLMANVADMVPTLPGLDSQVEWEEPRFREEWQKWQTLRREEREETRDWWLRNASTFAETRAKLRAPFGWYLDLLGFSQQWDLFRAGTRLSPQLEMVGQVCRAPTDCESTLLFRYGAGGVFEDLFENVRMRGQVYSWSSGPASDGFSVGCRALAMHFATKLEGLQEVECALLLVPTPAPAEPDAPMTSFPLQHERVSTHRSGFEPPDAPAGVP